MLPLALESRGILLDSPGSSTSDEIDKIAARWATTDAKCDLPRVFINCDAESFDSFVPSILA